jgi:hypothetical protein
MFNLPTPQTALGKAAERAILVCVATIIAAVLQDAKIGPVVYFALKTTLDVLNSNINNL